MRIKSEVNLSPVKTPAVGNVYTEEEAVQEAMRCLDCPVPYCQNGCPIHTPIPVMCRHIRDKDFAGAYALVAENNPLTTISCRVCPVEKLCQKDCTRSIRGEAVNTGALELFLNTWHDTHEASKDSYPAPEGKSVAVVGSGSAGLTCAAELLKAGCPVTIYDASETHGGVPKWGIPDFVLPPEVTEGVLGSVRSLGAEFVSAAALGRDITLEELQNKHSAVFLSLGAPVPVSAGIQGAMQAQDLLREVSLGRDPLKGCSVAVIGGGDTAIDAVRVAKKLGAEEVTLVYRRGMDEMPARREDVKAAEEEGVRFLWWTEPVEAGEGGLICRRTEPAAPDYPGGRKNSASVPGSEFRLEAEVTVLALGFVNTPVGGVCCDGRGRILTDEWGQTNIPGVFAGGDAVSGPSTVIAAAAAGKKAAGAILNYVKAKI